MPGGKGTHKERGMLLPCPPTAMQNQRVESTKTLLSCLALSIELRLSEPHGHSRDPHNHFGLPQLRIGTGGEMRGAEQPRAMARGAKHHAEQMTRSGAGVLARSGCSGVPLSSTFLPGKRCSPLTSLFAKGTESWEQPSGGCLPRAHGRARGWGLDVAPHRSRERCPVAPSRSSAAAGMLRGLRVLGEPRAKFLCAQHLQ